MLHLVHSKHLMKKYFLEFVVFTCGAIVMIFEIAGSRVLGPHLGTSIFVWTSLIGIILASLSAGYYLGGKLADRSPTYQSLAWIIILAAFFISLTTVAKDMIQLQLAGYIPGIKMRSVISSILLFSPASIFLGMVSPYAVRLKIKSLSTSGSTVGSLYAISTIGSIVGTFVAGFGLIPILGTTSILFLLGILLLVVSILIFILYGKSTEAVPAALMFFVLGGLMISDLSRERDYIDRDTLYNRIFVYETEDPFTRERIRLMRINNESSSAIFLDTSGLVYPYARFYRLAEHFNPGFSNGLMLGGGAYTYPLYFLEKYPEAELDVVEIDPALQEIAASHFGLKDDPRMKIIHADGRIFLNNCPTQYDVIYGDAYKSQFTIPWHLTTVEAVKQIYECLNPGGVALINIISSVKGKKSEFLQAELRTFREVFPQVLVYAVSDPSDLFNVQSIMLAAIKSSETNDRKSNDTELQQMLRQEVTDLIDQNKPVLRDEFAPVDYYTNKSI